MTEAPSRLPDSSHDSAASPAALRPQVRRSRRWLVWPLLLLLLGGGTIVLLRRVSAAPGAVYPTDTAAQGTVSVLVSGPGTLAPRATVPEPSPLGGIVSGLPAVGAVVRAGQVIGQIRSDTTLQAAQDAELNLQKAQAQLAAQQDSQAATQASRQAGTVSAQLAVGDARDTLQQAQTTLVAQERLYSVGAISRTELNTAQAAVQSAQNKLESAQAALFSAGQQARTGVSADSSTLRTLQLAVQQAQATLTAAQTSRAAAVLRAPASGVVISVDAVNGSNVNTGASLLSVADTSVMALPVQVDETQISQVKPGMTVRAALDALGGQTVEGKVTSVSPTAAVQNNISVFTVNAELPNPDGQLRAGMSAQSDIVVAEQSGLVVTSKAVQTVRARSYVQVVPGDALNTAADLAPQTTATQTAAAQTSSSQGGASQSNSGQNRPLAQASSAVQLNDQGAATAVQTRVRVGLSDGTSTVITSGLQEGDTVLLPQVTARSSARSTGSSFQGVGVPGVGGGTRGGFGGN